MSGDDEMYIPLKEVTKRTGIPKRSLLQGIADGRLIARRTDTPMGWLYETTMNYVEQFRRHYRQHVKKP